MYSKSTSDFNEMKINPYIFFSFKKEPAFYSSPPKTGNTRRSRSVSLRNNRKVGDLSDTTISSRLEWVSHFMVGFLTDEIPVQCKIQTFQ